jgi:hypothetical protein
MIFLFCIRGYPARRALTLLGRSFPTRRSSDLGRPKVEVETGLTNSTDTEVISGLEEGQVVLIR